MVRTLGEMKGAAMKIGQLASFIDTEFLPPEYAELYQAELAKLRTSAPPMPWERVSKVIEEEYGEPVHEHFAEFEPRGVRRRLDRPGAPREAARRPPGRGQDPVPRGRRGARVGHAQRRHARPAGEGARARASTRSRSPRSSRERVLEELDYEYEAQNQRTFSRAYRGHPFIYVPDVITRLSRRRVLVTEFVEGIGLRAR